MQLGQVILYVSNMGRSVKFYRDKLGLPVTFPKGKNFADQVWVTLGTGGCSLALHSGGTGRTEDLAPTLSFMTDDVDRDRAELTAKGVELSAIEQPYPGVKFCHGEDPDGHNFFVMSSH